MNATDGITDLEITIMRAWLRAMASRLIAPAKQVTAKTVQVASDATEAATPHVKEAIKASTDIAAEGLKGQRYRVNAAVGAGIVFGMLGIAAFGVLPLLSPVTGGLWGLIGGAILGASQATATVIVNQGEPVEGAE